MNKSKPEPFIDPTERMYWGERGEYYALSRVPNGATHFELSGKRTYLEAKNIFSGNYGDLLILGERGAGANTFLSWYTENLESQGKDWLLVNGDRWEKTFFKGYFSGVPLDIRKLKDNKSPKNNDKTNQTSEKVRKTQELSNPIKNTMEAACDAIHDFGQASDAQDQGSTLLKWAEDLENPCYLLIREFYELGSEKAFQAAKALRYLRDSGKGSKLKILILTSDEETFLDTAEQSGYLPLTQSYRLPHFNKKEIETLWREKSKSFQQPGKIPNFKVKQMTGGHPLLTQLFLNSLVDHLKSCPQKQVEDQDLEEVFRKLLLAPPREITIWKRSLLKILKANRGLIETFKGYVVGKSIGPLRFPPPIEERPLFVAGWIGLNDLGRWGILSRYHAELADSVLNELEGGANAWRN